jgi:cyclic beta-1,2-glucan synthetase
MYRAWVEEVLGLRVMNGQMRIQPVIPPAWPGFTISYRHGETVYSIQVENPHGCQSGVAWIEMDGQRVSGDVITLERFLVKHRIVVMMGEKG